MKSLFELCKPRASVFDETKRDDTVDLDNLIDGSINAEDFFRETYITDGMKLLFDTAFKRFDGTGASGLVKLTQAMGGGKTHNMVALGLLAKHPELRKKIFNGKYKKVDKELKVVAFTGRESDVPYGIWGEIAKQLGKEKEFEPYYAPLKAPGQSAWIKLLQGEPLLILLDEIPYYLSYARTVISGMGTLADITTTALSNLFNALGKSELSNVCIVVSDLRATYESGTELLEKSFKDLENEIGRSAINIEPVGTTSDDLYHILRTRLFETQPSEDEIQAIALAYKETVKQAQQMGYTNYSPDQVYVGIKDSYPFHPSIKDLFARFKENSGFQQTRGFIRLTRIMVKNLYSGPNPRAKSTYLLNSYDMDLNDPEMFSMVKDIKSNLANAIAHDIASGGKSIAEGIDKATNCTDMQDLSKLILVASLGAVTNVLLGLSLPEAIGYLAGPNRDITQMKSALEDYKIKAWYLYTDRDNRLYFKDIKNVNAEVLTLVDSYNNEIAKQEIRKILTKKFEAVVGDCYQEVLVFPAIDDINLKSDKVTLILFEPNSNGAGLQKDLNDFYENVLYKNRVMFLSGQRNSMINLLDNTKQLKAIQTIIQRMKTEDKVSEKDTQYKQANDILHANELNFLQSARETFITLFYPKGKGLQNHDFKMVFQENKFNAEEQIRDVLIEVEKFDKDTLSDEFRKKFEVRIFTTRQARWVDLKERVATNPAWPWHPTKALEEMKSNAIKKGIWIEEGGYIDKEPPAPETTVLYRQVYRNEETDEITLKLIPQNGDIVYYEIDGEATTASLQVKNINEFKTDELAISFLCVDSTGKNSTGPTVLWKNDIKLQYNTFDKEGRKYVELKASSSKAEIRYTTDGSSPKESGGLYDDAFEVPNGTKFVQAIACNEKYDIYSEVLQITIKNIKIEVDNEKPVRLTQSFNASNNAETFKIIEIMSKYQASIIGVSLQIFENTQDFQKAWIDISFDSITAINPDTLITQIDNIREQFFNEKNVEVSLAFQTVIFTTGLDFRKWIAENKYNLEEFGNKIKQSGEV